ncbi:MAG: nucleotide exchange factor GrpE [Candidatus Omnitrophica bacterium]|nr:nucleotide exchange factor GrpE [Candidatus Omnitrophota bacterium]
MKKEQEQVKPEEVKEEKKLDEQNDDEIEQLKKKAQERDFYYDKYVRTLAEHDNTRKRLEKDTENFIRFANEKIIGELFPILDSFDSAIENLQKTDADQKTKQGMELLQKKFHKVLEDNGLSVMNCKGEKFDPIKHEAVMKVESNEVEDGHVLEVLRTGYMLNDRVLRPAMVQVADNNSNIKEDKQQEEQQ